jgi:polyhydroxyalkanoate synthesis regulator phasin
MEAEAADTAEGQDSAEAGREVILTGSAVVVVDDTEEAAAAVVALAERHGGYVDGQQLSRDGADAAVREGGASVDTSYPAPYGQGSWVSLRVPADDIRAVLDELADIGELDSSQLTSDDVTTQAVDLRARVDATQISVDRLTDLMGQAGSLADLLAAEESLAARQAELESYQQQLTQLEDQVSMASLTVSLTTAAPPVVADPAGFGDGLAAGWDGLLATVNGVVIGLGFLLPWLGVLGVAAIVTWLLVRASRRRSARKDETENQP